MTQDQKPLHYLRHLLSVSSVMVRCLTEDRQPIPGASASGFIRREDDRLWLYTCWHVVTGFNPHDLKIGNSLPDRAYLEISMQDADARRPGVEVVGGLQSLIVPLYDAATETKLPLWHQDKRHVPNQDLNSINLFVPFWHDAIKILLPADTRVSDVQVIGDSYPLTNLCNPGDKVYVVGFPYGYSTVGGEQPTPVVLTRFVAATRIGGRHREILLDGYGAPCMSGGPVFVEVESGITFLGLYTGLLYPDHQSRSNEKVTALGTCSDMSFHFSGALPFVKIPDES